MTPDYKALRAAAERATPGPWEAVMPDDPRGQPALIYHGLVAIVSADPRLSVVTSNERTASRDEWEANARLIALANPATVTALLDEREALLAIIDEWRPIMLRARDELPRSTSRMSDRARALLGADHG